MASARLFVDTGAWLAVIDPVDQYHEPAQAFYRRAIENKAHFVTTNLVVAETYLLIRRRMGHSTAVRFLDLLAASHRLHKVWSNPELDENAEDILRKYQHQDFSYVDAVSFTAMEAQGLDTAFAFDHHYSVMGFVCEPAGALG